MLPNCVKTNYIKHYLEEAALQVCYLKNNLSHLPAG